MCGIVGVADARRRVDRDTLVRQRDTLLHRGPDAEGVFLSVDGCVGLAHRRLAIIDLTAAGQQPMHDAGEQCSIVFNGEIYNYRELREELRGRGHSFVSASDTEVILAAYREWGVDCLSRLNGMFAFGLYDASQRRLLLARDRAGEKPLFYSISDGRLVFASELKAIMADPAFPRVMDPDALDTYLAFGYVSGTQCLLKGVKKIPQGGALVFDVATGSAREWRYWRLPDSCREEPADPDQLVTELHGLLRDSVGWQLVADVPVAVLLSGGVDSSIIAAIAAEVAAAPVRTFTVSFPGHGALDEGPRARAIASHFGTLHTELVAESPSADLLPTLARQFDEPIADSSMIPTYLLSKVVREQATVALGGDGGDELFGGYPHYSWLQKQSGYRRVLPRPLRRAMSAVGRIMPIGARGRNHLIGFSGPDSGSVAHVNMYYDATTRRAISPLLRGNSHRAEDIKEAFWIMGRSAMANASAADFQTYLVDDILVKVDRASMLTSLEVRAPFLDHRVIEFAYGSVPDSLRAEGGSRKILLRRLARKLLPPSFDLSGKRGFTIPIDAWLAGPWGRYVASVLADAPPALFDGRTVRRVLVNQKRGYANGERILALTMLELWRREYDVQVPGTDGA